MSDMLHLGRIETRSLGSLDVYKGHSPNVVDQLIEKSPWLEDVVPKDTNKRFKTTTTFEEWVTKGDGGRSMYVALDPNRLRGGHRELAALCWLGEEPFPEGFQEKPKDVDPLHTYAIRVYGTDENHRLYEGQGVARRLSNIAIGDYAPHLLNETPRDGLEPSIGLETDPDNLARTTLYPRLGFEDVGTRFDPKIQRERAGMVLRLSTIWGNEDYDFQLPGIGDEAAY